VSCVKVTNYLYVGQQVPALIVLFLFQLWFMLHAMHCDWQESLRAKTTMSLADHQILLRFPCGLRNRHHGEEKAAIKVEQHLKAITLGMLTLVTMIE
jgi:hypothetical protein